MPDDDITDKARKTADALEAKAASVADDLQDVAIEQASKLQATMRDLAEQMIALANEMRALSSYGRRNRRLIRLLAVSVCFDVLLSLGLGVAFWRTQENSVRTDEIIAARTESRLATCHSDNRFITNHNVLVDAVEKSAEQVAAPSPGRTAEQQAQAEQFVAGYVATIEQARVPMRDCSPEAIEQFYKQPGG